MILSAVCSQQQGGAVIPFCDLDGRYRLDASEAEVLTLGKTRPAMSNFFQTATITLTGAQPGVKQYLAGPAGASTASSQTLDLSSDKKALEVVLAADLFDPAVTGYAFVRFVLSTPFGGLQLYATLTQVGAGGRQLVIGDATGGIFGASPSAGTERLTLELDCDAGTFDIRRNGGAPLVLTRNAFTPGQLICTLDGEEDAGLGLTEAGKTYSGTLRTRAADIVGPVTVGFTDVCGN